MEGAVRLPKGQPALELPGHSTIQQAKRAVPDNPSPGTPLPNWSPSVQAPSSKQHLLFALSVPLLRICTIVTIVTIVK